MPMQNQSNFKNPQLIEMLKDYFNGQFVITRSQFRDFMQLSISTEYRIFKAGAYPKIVVLPGGTARITLDSLAEWLEKGGCRVRVNGNAKKRGRPVGSRNKSRNLDSLSSKNDENKLASITNPTFVI